MLNSSTAQNRRALSPICLLDPGLENHAGDPSNNLGDLIIQAAVLRELKQTFPEQKIIQISTHAPLATEQIELINSCSKVLIGGTNLLSSNMNHYNQWKIHLRDALQLKRAYLLGVSWWQYQGWPNLYTQSLLHLALAHRGWHSVRDGYTKRKLRSIGIWNVINTGCPTMWPLAELTPQDIPLYKAKNALLMFTDYSQNQDLDRRLLELVIANYETVYFWPQGEGDHDYIKGMNLPITLLDRSLPALENLLNSDVPLDYIGTRLHGGIRCLLAKRRSLILKIDHRATEIAEETGLPAAARDDFDFIERWIQTPVATRILINTRAIKRWRQQFKSARQLASSVA